MLFYKLLFFLLLAFLLIRFRNFFSRYFHLFFGFYVFIVFFLWSLPRIVSYETMQNFIHTTRINFPFILSHYHTQYVPHSPLMHKYFPVIFSFSLFVLAFFLPTLVNLYKKYVDFELTKVGSKEISIMHIWGTGFFVVLYLLIKEILEPYFFTQDDNHAQFFPKILVGLKLLFSGGFPFIDNYQHFGAPLFEMGTYAIFDPVMIFSYIIGNYILKNPFTTLEIYVILCMFFGAVFLGYSFRLLKIDSLVSFTATVSFLFAGYFFITIRSWYYAAGITVYLPALFYFFLLSINNKLGWRWFFLTGFFRSFFFYAGNAQYFVYALIIEGFSYIYTAFKLKQGKVIFLHYFCSLILSAGVMLPLLIPQYFSLKEVPRGPESFIPGGTVSLDALVSTFLPYPFSWAPHPVGWGNKNTHLMPNMFHIGFVWVFALLIGFVIYIRTGKIKFAPVLVLALILFFLTNGAPSLIFPFKYYIPIVNKMSGPFKGYPFPVFTIILCGALLLGEIRKYVLFRKIITYPIVLSVLVTMLVGIFGTSTAFYTYGDIPYPKLSKKFLNSVNMFDVVFSYAHGRYDRKGYVQSLFHNYACVYDIKCVNHYDPLLPTMIWGPPPDPRGYFNNLGVTKVAVLKVDNSIGWTGELQNYLSGYNIAYEDENVVLFNTGNPGWIFRRFDTPSDIVGVNLIEYSRLKAKAKLLSYGKSVWEYHNEYREGYCLLVDGIKKKLLKSPNDWCMFELEPGSHNVEIGYIPPSFFPSFLLCIVIVLSSCFLFYILILIRQKTVGDCSRGVLTNRGY